MTQRWTLGAPARHEALIRKSRFLARAAPVADAVAAAAFLEAAADPGATHNCWAWRVGERYRFSDDGEPGGSAGRPILAAIDGQDMDAVAVVVTRWYGGIKLGVGGLVRAYGGTAAECLRTAPRRALVDLAHVAFALGYAEAERLRPHLAGWNARVTGEDWGASEVRIALALPRAHLDALAALLADLSRGRAELHEAPPGGKA